MTEQEINNRLRDPRLALRWVRAMEEIGNDFFTAMVRASEEGEINTIQEWMEASESNPSQQTGKLTITLAGAAEKLVSKILKEEGFPVLGKREIKGERAHDLRIAPSDGAPVPYEVKTSMATGPAWQGGTQSLGSGKAANYILIKYKVDTSTPLTPGGGPLHGMITDIHFSVIIDGAHVLRWSGSPTKKNSRTTGKILSAYYNTYVSSVLLGGTARKPKYVYPTLESVAKFRDSTGRIQLISQEVTDEAA